MKKPVRAIQISIFVEAFAILGLATSTTTVHAQTNDQPNNCGSEWSSGLNPGTGPEWQPGNTVNPDETPPFSNGPAPGTGPEWQQMPCASNKPQQPKPSPAADSPIAKFFKGLGF